MFAGEFPAGAVAAEGGLRGFGEVNGNLVGIFAAALAFAEQPGLVGGNAGLEEALLADQVAGGLVRVIIGRQPLNGFLGEAHAGGHGMLSSYFWDADNTSELQHESGWHCRSAVGMSAR